MRRGTGLIVLAIALAGCASQPSPSAEPAMTNFSGTSWRMVAIDGQALVAGLAPTIEFQSGAPTEGTGLAVTLCRTFSFDWTLDRGRARIRPVVGNTACSDAAGRVVRQFIDRLAASSAYVSSGDSLVLAGPAGQLQLARDIPPVGDPGRAVLDLLRNGVWRVASATGMPAGSAPSGIRFLGDTTVASTGECSFSGGYHLMPQGRVQFDAIGWDSTGCDATQLPRRDVVKPLLESATQARVGDDGKSVIFSGPNGEVVLGR